MSEGVEPEAGVAALRSELQERKKGGLPVKGREGGACR